MPHSGFRAGEQLPASRQAAVWAHAETVLRHAAGQPFALAGYSSGGLVAHAVAAELERRGERCTALVLLDTYRPDATELVEELIPQVLQGLLERQARMTGEGEGSDGDAWLTAMARYLQFDWTPTPIHAPTLLVRAATPMPGRAAGGEWQADWPSAETTLTVDGDHFTMLETHAADTARTVHDWLTERGGSR
ncbi:thioesterase domain-containing protein [Micromonospora sp. M12]